MKFSNKSFSSGNFQEIIPHIFFLRKIAGRFTRDRDEIDDIVQETLLNAFESWNKFKKGTNIKAWLWTIMKNGFINNYRLFRIRKILKKKLYFLIRDVRNSIFFKYIINPLFYICFEDLANAS